MHTPDNAYTLPELRAPTLDIATGVGALYQSVEVNLQGVTNHLTSQGLTQRQVNGLTISFGNQHLDDDERMQQAVPLQEEYLAEKKCLSLRTGSILQASVIDTSVAFMRQEHDNLEYDASMAASATELSINRRFNNSLIRGLEDYVRHCAGQPSEAAAFQLYAKHARRNFHLRSTGRLGLWGLTCGGLGYAETELLGQSPSVAIIAGVLAFQFGYRLIDRHYTQTEQARMEIELNARNPRMRPHDTSQPSEHSFVAVQMSDRVRTRLLHALTLTDCIEYDTEW